MTKTDRSYVCMSSPKSQRFSRPSQTPESAATLLERHLAAVTIELFETYGLLVEVGDERQAARDNETVTAIIGFTSDRMCGSLLLSADVTTVERWRRSIGGEGATPDVCDVLGELANMLLGRVKLRLLRDGLPIAIATPATLRGRSLVVRAAKDASSLLFDGDDWQLSTTLYARFDRDFGFKQRSTEAPAEAGDLLLF